MLHRVIGDPFWILAARENEQRRSLPIMASLQQHMLDCQRLIGQDCEDVNKWMDVFFSDFGPFHRFKRHHREGVYEAELLFGDLGRRAAIIHILRDCRHIPRQSDYANGKVDRLGLIANWPVTAYIKYSDDAFERLAMFSLNGPEAILNLGFFKIQQDLEQLIITSNPQGADDVKEIVARWPASVEARDRLLPLNEPNVQPLTDRQQLYVDGLSNHPLMLSIRQQFPTAKIILVDAASLINPLVLLDREYVEQLRAELIDTDDLGVIKFAIPTEVNLSTQISIDSDMRGISIVSMQKQVTAMPVILDQIPGVGIEVKFNIIGTPQLILASQVNGRLYLKNGMHRAYLLASLGISNIPIVIVEEREVLPIATVYPSFNTSILNVERPPLLIDMLDANLTANIRINRTQKVVRIRVEELVVLPVQ